MENYLGGWGDTGILGSPPMEVIRINGRSRVGGGDKGVYKWAFELIKKTDYYDYGLYNKKLDNGLHRDLYNM